MINNIFQLWLIKSLTELVEAKTDYDEQKAQGKLLILQSVKQMLDDEYTMNDILDVLSLVCADKDIQEARHDGAVAMTEQIRVMFTD